ncbi:site-specific integrase [Peptoniphilus sp. MSJ-1]|uniref:Site-specific integrase n=1 Tax=Peptoniphilus ovalis TaxID=2841503 RepID=A0ABS6FE85_9FIRM|nr:site-specific integrase [Peptoniphilus ovalis]MBU5668495.1 site-specific integrase [Peptoniphilus ovalis]
MNLDKLDEKQIEFLKIKKLEGLAKTTLDGYYKIFLNVNTFARLEYEKPLKLKFQLLDYFTNISNNKNTTFNAKRKGLNTFFNYLITQNVVSTNPIKELQIKKRKENTYPRPCSSEELKEFLKVIDINTYAGLRDYTFTILIADTGVRPAEATRLREKHINIANSLLELDESITKTSKPRILPLSKLVLDNLLKLLELNQDFWNSDSLFLTSDGREMTTVNFQRRFVKHSKASGVKITPYQLRHFFGTEYLKNPSGNLIYLQNLMGHSDISMTKKYIGIDKKALENNHKIATPLNLILERNTRVRKLFKNK